MSSNLRVPGITGTYGSGQAESTVNAVQAADPASKTIYTFTDVGALHNAIKVYGYIPVRPDGSPFNVQYLQEYDGYVLDGAPINVWMEGVWLEGQKEAMAKYWASGQVPQPPANLIQAGAVPMPVEVQQRTVAYQESQAGGGLFGLDTGTLFALGVGVLAIVMISGKGGRKSAGFTDVDF